MQSLCAGACEHFSTSFRRSFLGLSFGTVRTGSIYAPNGSGRGALSVSYGYGGSSGKWKSSKKVVDEKEKEALRKGKENVWSVDNEMAEREKEGKGEKRGKRRAKSVSRRRRRGGGDDGRVVISGAMLVEIETVLQTQCLVKGCHRRLRIVHTIDFNNGGADIQIMRVAVYEEEWDSPANMDEDDHQSGGEFELKLFSQRKRTQPSQLTGSWKVFEVSATPIFGADASLEESNGSDIPYVYLCTETIKKRSLPDNPVHFGEDEMLDMQDATILWLPGGVTAYVDVDKDGTLCIGVGWYSDEGINLVMERDYGTDGKLKEVRWKSEVKRRWSDQIQA